MYFTEKKVFVALMIIQSGNGCGSTVAMRRVSPKKGGCCNSSGTLSKCYSGVKVVHQAPKWCHQHDALLVQAHRRMGGGWTNTKGPGEEMEMVILKKYKR